MMLEECGPLSGGGPLPAGPDRGRIRSIDGAAGLCDRPRLRAADVAKGGPGVKGPPMLPSPSPDSWRSETTKEKCYFLKRERKERGQADPYKRRCHNGGGKTKRKLGMSLPLYKIPTYKNLVKCRIDAIYC